MGISLIKWLFPCIVLLTVNSSFAVVTKEEQLKQAVNNGKLSQVSTWIGKGANVNALVDNFAPLHLAAYSDHIAIARLLIQHGADVNIVNTDNVTPLMAAAHGQHPGVVRLLLFNNADPGVRDNTGRTAYDYALNPSVRRMLGKEVAPAA